jgi:hypothetical protein
VSKRYYGAGPARNVAVSEGTTNPAVPEDATGAEASPPVVGQFGTDGADLLIVDVLITGPQSVTGLIDVLAWDSPLQAWVLDTTLTVANTPATQRFKVTSWCSRWAFARATTVGTNATNYRMALQAGFQGS